MGGLQRFQRRYAMWLKMRDAMHTLAYDSECHARLRRLARVGILCILISIAFAALVGLLGAGMAAVAHAQPVATDHIPRAAAQHKLQLRREAQRVWGLGAPVATFAAQIHQESRWRADATSPVGAQGLAQFMPATARWIGTVYPTGPGALAGAQATNPAWAIRGLVTYDRWLWDRIKADTACERMAYTLSAYNGGLGWVYKRQARSPAPGTCMGATCDINPGIHPASQRENAHYPRVILLRYEPLYATWGKGACT